VSHNPARFIQLVAGKGLSSRRRIWIFAATTIHLLAVSGSVFLAFRGEEPSLGQRAFERICSGCHGPKAGGDVGPPLVPFHWVDREVLAIVREGNGMMPAMSARDISDEEVVAVAEYLRSLAKADEKR
jgi:mono/diheme cytochrome c family protein